MTDSTKDEEAGREQMHLNSIVVESLRESVPCPFWMEGCLHDDVA